MYDRHDLRWDGHRLRLRSGRAGARRMTATRMSRFLKRRLWSIERRWTSSPTGRSRWHCAKRYRKGELPPRYYVPPPVS